MFQKIAGEILSISFYDATIMLIPRPDAPLKKKKNHTQTRKLQANITDEHRCKNEPNTKKHNPTTN